MSATHAAHLNRYAATALPPRLLALQSMGPNVATPELFAKALFTDTSSWTVIDRGPFEALLPITVSFEKYASIPFRCDRGRCGWKSRNRIRFPNRADQFRSAEATSTFS